MDLKKIQTLISTVPSLHAHFIGLFTKEIWNDNFSTLLKNSKPGFCIIYIDSDKIGHFVSLTIDKLKNIYFFDSYGKNASYYNVKVISNEKNYNNLCLQSPNSCLCGVFVLYFNYFLFSSDFSYQLHPQTLIDKHFKLYSIKERESKVYAWMLSIYSKANLNAQALLNCQIEKLIEANVENAKRLRLLCFKWPFATQTLFYIHGSRLIF